MRTIAGFKITATTLAAAVAMTLGLLLFMVVVGGLAVLLSLAVSAVTLIFLPVLWLAGKRRRAVQLLTAWGIYLAVYLTISTGMALVGTVLERPLPIGKEVCADSGCFAVDKVDRTAAAPEASYTLYWHLSSNDKELTKHFPGKGLELFMFDERGRKFALPKTADQNPLDITLPAGETVRQSITFSVPADTRQLFLTAKYRPFTFQSLFPGELSLVPRKPAAMIRIQ
jgi:hypothetical protein